MTSPHVNYEGAARDYAKRRTPTAGALSIWADVVAPYAKYTTTVIDLASGAGAFSGALRDWGTERVVAVEPSIAMQTEAVPIDGVLHVTGRAEAIPVRTRTVDLIWISMAFHHFEQPQQAVRECRRVLVDDGKVAIRGFVPSHSELAWLRLFPGSDKAIARFPDLETMNALFSESGFGLVHEQVVEQFAQTYAQRADFSEQMRHADSVLTAMSDADVDAGIAALRARPDEIEHFAVSFLIYELQ